MCKRTTLDLGLSDGKESLKVKTTKITDYLLSLEECEACHGRGVTEDEECGFFAIECEECDGNGHTHKEKE